MKLKSRAWSGKVRKAGVIDFLEAIYPRRKSNGPGLNEMDVSLPSRLMSISRESHICSCSMI